MAIVLADSPSSTRARKEMPRGRIPGKKQLEREAVQTLRSIMRMGALGGAYINAAVGAARTILEYATSDPVAEAFAMLHGSDEQALAWLKAKTESLEAKIAERSGGADSSDERNESVRR